MGKRGVIILVIVISLAVVLFSNIFEKDYELREVSQVTGCTVDGYCGTAVSTNGEFTLVIGDKFREEFYNKYLESKEKEFLFCLTGFKKSLTYYITDYYEPNYLESEKGRAVYSSCRNDSIGTLHNHYNPTNEDYFCQLSARDIYTFGQSNDDLMGIICGKKIVFIHKSDLKPVHLK